MRFKICLQASNTAIPYKSVLILPADGMVLATLSELVGFKEDEEDTTDENNSGKSDSNTVGGSNYLASFT